MDFKIKRKISTFQKPKEHVDPDPDSVRVRIRNTAPQIQFSLSDVALGIYLAPNLGLSWIL